MDAPCSCWAGMPRPCPTPSIRWFPGDGARTGYCRGWDRRMGYSSRTGRAAGLCGRIRKGAGSNWWPSACATPTISLSMPPPNFSPSIRTWNGTWARPGTDPPACCTSPAASTSAGAPAVINGRTTTRTACRPWSMSDPVRPPAWSSAMAHASPPAFRPRCSWPTGATGKSTCCNSSPTVPPTPVSSSNSWPARPWPSPTWSFIRGTARSTLLWAVAALRPRFTGSVTGDRNPPNPCT